VSTGKLSDKCLDLFITIRPFSDESCNTIDGIISDHETVFVSSTVLVLHCHPVRISVYLWSQADFDHVRQEIQSLYKEFTVVNSFSTPVNMLWNDFILICNIALNKVPTKFNSYLTQPWIYHNLKQLGRKKQRASNRARTTSLPSDWSKQHELKSHCQRNVIGHFTTTSLLFLTPSYQEVVVLY